MTPPSRVADSIVLLVVSFAAGVTTIGGLLLAGLGAILRSVDLGAATPIVSQGLMGVGIAMALGGAVASVLRRAHRVLADIHGVWQLLLAATLVAIPVALALWLSPLADLWRDVLVLAQEEGVFNQNDWSNSGLVVVPVAVILALPLVQAFTAVVVALSCALTLPLVALRSASLLRVLLVTVVLTGGLVVSGAWGSSSFERLMPIAEQAIRDSPDPSGTERPQVLALLQRYQDVTRRSALTLGWAWLGLLVWVPLLAVVAPYRAGSADASAAPPAAPPVPPGPDIASTDAAERERAYRDAAKKVDRSSGPAW